MQEKAEQGIWPTKTPLGYRNITGPDSKKIIAPIRRLRQSWRDCSNGMHAATFC